MSEARESAQAAVPLPERSVRMQPFWDAACQGRLVLPRCGRCHALHFPAFATCALCLSDKPMEWVPASGRGAVFSFVVMHQVYHPAFAADVPYAVVDVKLEEGPRMISRVVDVAPTEIRVGMAVEITFVRVNEEIHLPMFRPTRP